LVLASLSYLCGGIPARSKRLMRENGLLSPHRTRLRKDEQSDRRINTDVPDIM
jgi:hypothetical protein